MTKIQETGDHVLANVERVIVGKHHEVRLALVALLCRGHLLIEDVPGTGKTVLAKAIARSLGCSFRRIQFTPDLLPSDVTGLSIYNQKTQEFEFRPGPIMSQVVLADEINRATPKTQSALLECMEERQATVDGITYPMPDPFLVIATQNPIEYEGTFALPEAQLDRFMLRIRLGYPQPLEEIVILDEQKRTHPLDDLAEVCSVEELRELQAGVREIYVDPAVSGLHRPPGQLDAGRTRTSTSARRPRGSIALYRAGQALAGLLGRDYVIPDDIKAARRARPGAPADHQDQLVHPRRLRRRTSSASCSTRPRSRPPDQRGGPRAGDPEPRAPSPGTRLASSAPPGDRCSADSSSSSSPSSSRSPRSRRATRSCSSSCTSACSSSGVVHPHAAGAVRPRGGLRGEPAAGHVGDRLRITYTLRNTGRMPKPWLEVHNPTTLPGGLPGRAISLGGRDERSWLVRTPLDRRGHYRIEPLQIRTGDPFGFFEASAAVGQGVTLVVYPKVDALPLWKLPPASIEGAHAQAERTLQTTPLATTVRPYAPGDSMNRIHWRSTAKHGEIQVKEFDLEQTADAWIFLDLDAAAELGSGETSTTEVAVRVAASVAEKALSENRAVGLTVNGHRMTVLPADRGARQRLKILQLLAAVEADGRTPLDEALLTGLSRLRRGMTAIVISASQDPSFVRPLAALRTRGIGTVVISLDAPAFEPAPDEAAAGRRSQARARPPPHARRVPAADLHGRTHAGPGRGAGPMTMTELRVRRPSEGWITLALVTALALDRRVGDRRAPYVNGKGEPHRLPGHLRPARGPRRVRGTEARLGPLDDPPHGRAVRGHPDPGGRRLDGPPGHLAVGTRSTVAQGSVSVYLDLAWRGLQLDQPGDPLHGRVRVDRVGDLAVRLLRGLRPPPPDGGDRGPRARPAGQHGADAGPADVHHRVHGARCSCSSRCTRSTSARRGSAAGSATRRRSRACTCAAGRCSSSPR